MVATGHQKVAPTASHATVQLVLRLVLSIVTRVRLVTTALLVVNLVHAMTVRLVHSMANAQLAHLTATAHLVVISVHAMTVRLVHSVTATHVRVVTLVQTAQRVRLVPTVMVVAQTA
jgi:hypothetical protein